MLLKCHMYGPVSMTVLEQMDSAHTYILVIAEVSNSGSVLCV